MLCDVLLTTLPAECYEPKYFHIKQIVCHQALLLHLPTRARIPRGTPAQIPREILVRTQQISPVHQETQAQTPQEILAQTRLADPVATQAQTPQKILAQTRLADPVATQARIPRKILARTHPSLSIPRELPTIQASPRASVKIRQFHQVLSQV